MKKKTTTKWTYASRSKPTDFVDALALQAVEAFVARVRTRVISERTSFAAAVEHELADWREAVPEEARRGESCD